MYTVCWGFTVLPIFMLLVVIRLLILVMMVGIKHRIFFNTKLVCKRIVNSHVY